MDSIKDIIPQVIEGLAVLKPDTQQRLERVWQNILEKKEQAHARIVGLRQGKIAVCVDSPAWMYQMKMRKGKILERLREEFPDVVDVSFKIGNVK